MRKFNRFLAVFLIAFLLIGLFPSAYAEEAPEEVDPYTIHFYVPGDGYNGPRYQYYSPYTIEALYDGQTRMYYQHYVRNLYNIETQEIVPAYCTDILAAALSNKVYRMLNLEDSTYAAGMAGLLRAIVLEGFWLDNQANETEAAHAVRVAAELEALGAASGVEDLTIGEAVAATQAAVWLAAHGSRLQYTDLLDSLYTYGSTSTTKYHNLCIAECNNGHVNYSVASTGAITVDSESDAWITERIRTVCNYLISLEPAAPSKVLVSNASFVKTSAEAPVANDDGTYDVKVSVTVDVQMSDGDLLTLTASAADAYYASAELVDGKQTVELTLRSLPEAAAYGELQVQINGEQSTDDVYLFEAQDGRDGNQSMIGQSMSRTSVHAEVAVQPERVIHLFKTTGLDIGRVPLEGIIFDIYFVASMDDYNSGAVTVPPAEEYSAYGSPIHTLVTDSSGYAFLDMTAHGLQDGIYYVVEQPHPAISEPVAPFYLSMPMTAEDGSEIYSITVRPKNTVKGNVYIEKDVHTLGNNEHSVNAYEDHTWIIGTNIPEDIELGKSFVITDELDPCLDYIGNELVQVETVDGTTVLVELVAQEDYILALNDVDSVAEGTGDSFTLSLTRIGMQKLATALSGRTYADYMLRVYFDAQINSNGEMGVDIPNQATVQYTNSVNFSFNSESDLPVVNMGGARLLKVDASDHSTVLEGATFALYRRATEQEVAAGEGLVTVEGQIAPMVPAYFYDNAALSGEKVSSASTDADGFLGFYGLAYGEYYLVETEAPEGYNLLRQAVQITIDATTHTEEMTFTVENVQGGILPGTGGIGTQIFYICGFTMVLIAVVFLVSKRRFASEDF